MISGIFPNEANFAFLGPLRKTFKNQRPLQEGSLKVATSSHTAPRRSNERAPTRLNLASKKS